MTDDPKYHDQPSTLDTTKDPIPEDAPLAQGHTDEDAANTREAHEETKAAYEDEPDEQVTARAPGDHASDEVTPIGNTPGDMTRPTTFAKPDEVSGVDDSDQPPSGTVEEVKAWVGDDPQRAQSALEAERSGQNRPTLITHLEGVAR